ncbi:hypothetical protein NE237_026781 [Protea cynaroides]|uniref:Uncharacterized protein n=1 Tax=Protea cynaroides TaxID=273540 RepID=A0A9Q0GMB1_9MAGN|nr:hypothetical protein NE237_026781 [Protea cynaroides]
MVDAVRVSDTLLLDGARVFSRDSLMRMDGNSLSRWGAMCNSVCEEQAVLTFVVRMPMSRDRTQLAGASRMSEIVVEASVEGDHGKWLRELSMTTVPTPSERILVENVGGTGMRVPTCSNVLMAVMEEEGQNQVTIEGRLSAMQVGPLSYRARRQLTRASSMEDYGSTIPMVAGGGINIVAKDDHGVTASLQITNDNDRSRRWCGDGLVSTKVGKLVLQRRHWIEGDGVARFGSHGRSLIRGCLEPPLSAMNVDKLLLHVIKEHRGDTQQGIPSLL